MIYNTTTISLTGRESYDTILKKIALQNDSLPKYISVDNLTSVQGKKGSVSIKYVDLINLAKEDQDINFSSFYDSVNKLFPNLSPREILEVWIAYNSQLNSDVLSFAQIYLDDMRSIFGNLVPDISSIFNNNSIFEENIYKALEELKYQLDELEASETIINNLVPIKYTDFVLDKINREIISNLNLPLLAIFDLINVSEEAPFATTNNFYKIHHSLDVKDESWVNSDTNFIRVQIFSHFSKDVNEEGKHNRKYIPIEIYNDESGITHIFYTQTKNSTIQTKILNLFFMKNYTINDVSVSGTFYFPNTSFDKFIFADLLFTEEIMSSILYINESIKASKEKNSVYLHYLPENKEDKVNSNVTEITTPDVNLGNTYVKVKITEAKDIDRVKLFQDRFSQLYSFYLSKVDEVTNIYRKFIPLFRVTQQVQKEIKKHKLKDIVPDLFISGYSRKCLNSPVIVTDEEAQVLQSTQQVMTYPKPSSGLKSFNYICEPKDGKIFYPGLKPNTLENSKIYPYIPCCYPVDQRLKSKSSYNIYFSDKNIKKINTNVQYLFKSNKFLPVDIPGELPLNLEMIFTGLFQDLINETASKPNKFGETNEDPTFVRLGVFRDVNSPISCLLQALDKNYRILSDDSRVEKSASVRKDLLKLQLSLAKQEMYDYTTDQIKEFILNKDKYLDPKMFIRLLEEYFHVNIFLFGREGYIVPRHLYSYLSWKPQYQDSVLLFEHIGSESNMAKYPQTEIIVLKKSKNRKKYIYKFPIDRVLWLVDKLYINYSFTTKRERFYLDKDVNVNSQYIDDYGKTRIIKVGSDIIYTEPIPPLNVKIEDLEIKNDEPLTTENIKIGNVNGYILYNGEKDKKEFEIDVNTQDISRLDFYNFDRKISKYLLEYFLYLFSIYYNKSPDDNEIITRFIQEKILVIPDFKYKNVDIMFSLENGLMKDNKLVVPSDEMLRRLSFTLSLMLQQNKNKVLEYNKNIFIPNYYEDITDFERKPSELLLQGQNSFLRWINIEKRELKLSKTIIPLKIEPYFFMDNESQSISLAQNNNSLEASLYVSDIWEHNRYNAGFNPKERLNKNIEYNLYSYKNSKNITRIKKGGDIIIYGYIYNKTPKFTSLLK